MTSQADQEITRRTAIIRGGTLAGLVLGGTATLGSASAHGPPDEFPGSETGEENSEKGRENAAEKGKGKGQPPGTDDGDNGGGPGIPPGQ